MEKTSGTPTPITEQPHYKVLWADAFKTLPKIEPDIVALVDRVNLNVGAYKTATGNFVSGINPAIFGPLFQNVKDRLAVEGKDTDDATILLTASLEADARVQALSNAPKNDSRAITEGIHFGKLGEVSEILKWLDDSKSSG